MRFIIADDVFYARKAVEKMVMEWDPESRIVASCDNGMRVLKLLAQESVDVLILDIRMPGVDGLEVSETVRQEYPRIKILLVTGYADFEYARSALKNGVFRYLLKPLKKEELFSALNELKGMLLSRSEKKAPPEEVRRAMNSYRMMGFLSGGEGIEPIYPLPEKVLERGYFTAVVLCPGLSFGQLSNAVEGIFSPEAFLNGDMLHGGRWLLLTCNSESLPLERFQAECLEGLELLTQRIPAHCGLVAMAGAAPVSVRVPEMPACYLKAKRALAMRLIRVRERVFLFEEGGERQLLSPEDVRMVRGKLQAHKGDEVARLMEKKLAALPRLRLGQAEQIYHDFLSIALSLRMERGQTGEGRLAPRQLWDFDTKAQVEDYLNDLMYGDGDVREDGEGNLVSEIKAFLRENYYCEISLNDLAATRYFMNPNYLSRLFKSREGVGFSKYLLKLRMEKARELLQKGDMSINEVAAMVGYASTSYFIANFKKYYGETPGNLSDAMKEK